MIDDKFALEQINRMAGLHFFPKNEKAPLNELKMALMIASTEEIAKRLVDDIVATMSEAPTPADVRRMAYDANEKAEQRRIRGCAKCGYTGWRQVVRGMYSGVERCQCQGGEGRGAA